MARVEQLMDMLYCVQRAAVLAVGVLLRLQVGLENRFEHQDCSQFRDTIFYGGNSERPLSTSRLVNHYPAYRLRLIGSAFQRFRQFVQPIAPRRTSRCPRTPDRLPGQHHGSRGSGRRRKPGRPSGTPCRTERRTDSSAIPSLYRATPSAASEHYSGLLDSSPIPLSFAAASVSSQPRPLPSTGITRFPRYYGPPRDPRRPGLTLTRCQLIPYRQSPLGLPVLRLISYACMPSPLPRQDRENLFARTVLPTSTFPDQKAGQLLH